MGSTETDLKELQDHVDKQLVKKPKDLQVSARVTRLTDSIKLQMDNLISEKVRKLITSE